ncbi:hypothetical protein Q8W71_08080 [Methylobacterium sp. NEAU 140]|uniref:hypothetical protein n=1 Tax=Methylobacterium sp. NEAU 140 TaxID=3064945 RepID=UPI002733205F|nr:hypothetical protein [Methylobacterium sp. NEAU 140]MDP4022575.1 hypothetical protein [Methylobacterium sp. NEAU 140]
MLKTTVLTGTGGRVVIMDSITKLAPEDAGAHVVSASHGGISAGEVALAVPLASVFFNDAGVGKDGAGIAALAMLEAAGVAAGTVGHATARIGDGWDTWENGVISHANGPAAARGLVPGRRLGDALAAALRGPEAI